MQSYIYVYGPPSGQAILGKTRCFIPQYAVPILYHHCKVSFLLVGTVIRKLSRFENLFLSVPVKREREQLLPLRPDPHLRVMKFSLLQSPLSCMLCCLSSASCSALRERGKVVRP